jgi:hypothetical protein
MRILAYKKESICRGAMELNNTGKYIFKIRCKWKTNITKYGMSFSEGWLRSCGGDTYLRNTGRF